MATETKYLDYEGLKKYHKKLITKLKNLDYDAPRIFLNRGDLFTVSNWFSNPYAVGDILGAKEGLLVTVGTELWQLVDPALFKSKFTVLEDKSTMDAEDLGWKVIKGDFEINGNILKLN